MTGPLPEDLLPRLRQAFGERLQQDVPLARYTTAHVGGPADALLVANTANDLADLVLRLCQMQIPFHILGGGSNILISDKGVRKVVVLNRARQVRFNEQADPPTAWAESGTNFGALARQAAARGLSGLEWAAGIPGTIGGAVVGNAGAHGGDMASCLKMAEIVRPQDALRADMTNITSTGRLTCTRQEWPPEKFEFAYRTSVLKRKAEQAVVLAATLKLEHSTPEAVQAKIEAFTEYRHRTQPPGASMGSMFKNPPGDYAGRLIDAAGLKGTRVGQVEISSLHGNFFINQGQASATDIYALIELVRQTVAEKFGVQLELEIELIGEWH